MAMINGILNIDKPAGLTSHDVVQRVRRLSHQKRVGHAGTLDPMATGVLLLCLGRATRVVRFLQDMPKLYRATIRFGVETDTYDADGRIVARQPVPPLSEAQIITAFGRFTGEIEQVPPMYSALKRNGQPLYKLARAGRVVERPPRRVTIYALTLLQWRPPDLTLTVRCSAGTYIRSLAHDLGEVFGCGAHLIVLDREAVGTFRREDAVALAELEGATSWERFLQPMDLAIAQLPALEATDREAALIRHGQVPFAWQESVPPRPWLRVYHDGDLLALLAWEVDRKAWRAVTVFAETA